MGKQLTVEVNLKEISLMSKEGLTDTASPTSSTTTTTLNTTTTTTTTTAATTTTNSICFQ